MKLIYDFINYIRQILRIRVLFEFFFKINYLDLSNILRN
jgi:hypothetical protein